MRGDQLTRGWRLLVLLRRRRWTIDELASELGVNSRTVRRYLYLLRDVGLPVQNVGSARGPDTGLWTVGAVPSWPRREQTPTLDLR